MYHSRSEHFVGGMLWFATVWSLWLHRNEVIFNNGNLDFEKVIDSIKVSVWTWCDSYVKKGCFSFVDWCINPFLCLQSALVI